MLFFCLPESVWDRTWRSEHNSHGIVLEEHPENKHAGENTAIITVEEVPEVVGEADPNTKSGIISPASTPLARPSPTTSLPMSPSQTSNKYSEGKNIRQGGSSNRLNARFLDKSDIVFLEYADSHSSTPPNGPCPSAVKQSYTDYWRSAPKKSYVQSLALCPGRVSSESWKKAAIRPFILFAYPSVLWSALVYSLSIGWLVVLSESVSEIYRNSHTYNFTSFQVGLVYLSAFTGGVLGTALAGKVSDFIVRFMASRNEGIFEPEFRLVMALPVAICSVAGLMGFGWSVEERDNWIVPTVFFGIISFGCSLGSTTAITFCVDSYRQYAGEALVTLNFSKSESLTK